MCSIGFNLDCKCRPVTVIERKVFETDNQSWIIAGDRPNTEVVFGLVEQESDPRTVDFQNMLYEC